MNREELRGLVAEMLGGMSAPVPPQTGTGTAHAPVRPAVPEAGDLTRVDLRKLYLVDNPVNPDAYLALKARTPARIGLGRAGARYRTETMLRFRADHAAAQDSVFSDIPDTFAAQNGLVPVQTKCKDKDEYLTRPDLGRRFDEENQHIIQKTCGTNPQILLVIGDGLSSTAIETNAMDCAKAIRQGLRAAGARAYVRRASSFGRGVHNQAGFYGRKSCNLRANRRRFAGKGYGCPRGGKSCYRRHAKLRRA